MPTDERLVAVAARAIDPTAWEVTYEATARQHISMVKARAAIDAINASVTHRVERAELRQAAEEFVAKVDRGEARSVRSYAAFKHALRDAHLAEQEDSH